jgi:hypothetical protein
MIGKNFRYFILPPDIGEAAVGFPLKWIYAVYTLIIIWCFHAITRIYIMNFVDKDYLQAIAIYAEQH